MLNQPFDITICIFAKAPVRGLVKTRLAASIGAEPATKLATAFLQDTLATVQLLARTHAQPERVRVVLALAGNRDELADADYVELLRAVSIWPQGDGDLGARLERHMQRALTDSNAVIAIGTDSPGLPPTLLTQAMAHLQTTDAVVGPADDGGYYLLGLRSCPPGLLANIAWSTAATQAQTVAALAAHGQRWTLLDAWFDVDTDADLQRLQSLISNERVHAPATAAALRALELLP